jgi:hypothetical protein
MTKNRWLSLCFRRYFSGMISILISFSGLQVFFVLVFGCPELALGGFLDCVKRWFRETASDWLAGGASLLEEVFLTSSKQESLCFLWTRPSPWRTFRQLHRRHNHHDHQWWSSLPHPPRRIRSSQAATIDPGDAVNTSKRWKHNTFSSTCNFLLLPSPCYKVLALYTLSSGPRHSSRNTVLCWCIHNQ